MVPSSEEHLVLHRLEHADLLRRGDHRNFLADAEVEAGLFVLVRGAAFSFVASQALHSATTRQNPHSLVVLPQRRIGLALVCHEKNLVPPRLVVGDVADEARLSDGV